MRLEVGQGFLLELQEAEDDVHDLDARVVDVVLGLDGLALVPQAADERVAQAGVAEMADVGGLVGIDVGVLDDDLGFVGVKRPAFPRRPARFRRRPACRERS